ncbi:polysaccharide pyruvyl transferase family protein [Rhizobium sp. CNPSo 3968]|uniref:polysaccharide pyruvyl transferase family protein n=1 Tax=Rhizobium sp. CNPSo 3968 TaxID=3021408 RepID=UPI000DDF1710|nr:polysaccharide pyruvyl transferase family protein [Rhizobium sp. CNPSo 3968]MDK4718521.1 polysaccharide pyruvyl transferase family protein [Rhizobium sp. CNPSo 3968]
MKIVVFNVKYSENLGDGLLAECVEAALMKSGDGIEVETIDLAGRRAYAATNGGRRRLALGLLRRLPFFARRRLVRLVLELRLNRLRGLWDEKIAHADAVIIGGGNLFQDDDLNFPLKIGEVLDCVSRYDRPLAVYAVGVSKQWSEPAYDLFARLRRTRLVHLSVRDGFAQDNWQEHFPEGPSAKIVRDPGLLVQAMATVEKPASSTKRQLTVGLCVTDPVILHRHSGDHASSLPFCSIGAYRDLIGVLLEDGQRVVLFCNGAREDQLFAERIRNSVRKLRVVEAGALDIASRPRVPADLIQTIQSMDVILAHRLHACIAAYALKVPHVGLGWDSKVEGFFNSVGRETFFIKDSRSPAIHVALLLKAAEKEGIEALRHRVTIAEAQAGISNMRRHLVGSDECAISGI